MTREVYTDKEFIEFSRQYVCIRIMDDVDEEGPALVRRFRIEGTPTILVLNSSGREVGRLLGGRGPSELIDDLKDIIAGPPKGRYKL